MDRRTLSVETVDGTCRNVAKRTDTVPGQRRPKFGLRRQKVSLWGDYGEGRETDRFRPSPKCAMPAGISQLLAC